MQADKLGPTSYQSQDSLAKNFTILEVANVEYFLEWKQQLNLGR